VTDAAHAVDEGADAIMLAGETAVGRYPVKAVRTLAAIVQEAERAAPAATPPPDLTAGFPAHGLALCEAAVTLARRAKAAALVAVTRAGKTARSLAALRPDVPIFAATPVPETVARLALVWGVTPVLTAERSVAAARQTLLARGDVPSGSIVVFVSVHPVPEGEQTNFVHVEQVS
jgi:pyruvate kinase